MKRYYNDEPEPNDFFDPEDQEDFDDEEEFLRQAMMSDQGVDDQKINTLAVAISVLSSNWFWRFKNHKNKLRDINEVYLSLQQLMNPEE